MFKLTNKTLVLALILLLPGFALADDFVPQAITVSQNPRTFYELSLEFLYQGGFHIAIGWDHLAFIFCLCVLAPNIKSLILTISAFTIGHSISMALAFLGWVNFPIAPIEVIIAMSIVLMAREAWMRIEHPNKQDSILKLNIVVVAFGLIHGLGFASALSAVGVLAEERVVALVFFNLGVEFGQIMFVLLISAIIAMFSRIGIAMYFTKTMLIISGSIGCFWALQRFSGF
jgi:hypothetical protein